MRHTGVLVEDFEAGFPLQLPIVRVVRLAPVQAELALDAAVLGGRLELRPDPVGHHDSGIGRRFLGRLRSRWGWFDLAFELELAPWSATRTELVLRPLGAVEGVRRRRWYFAAGHAFMDGLVTAMEIPTLSTTGVGARPDGSLRSRAS